MEGAPSGEREGVAVFFVVTTGRSGSTTLARTLDRVERIHAVHEPDPNLVVESCGLRSGTLTKDEVKAVIRQTRSPEVQGKVYVESNQTLALLIPELAQLFPDARFIWLVRNGMDVVASTYQKQWYTGHSENHERYEDSNAIERAWIDGRVRGDRVGEMSEAEWEALDRFERCCWYWGYVNRVIDEDLQRHASGRFYTLRLEDLERELAKLIDWMGFNVPDPPGVTRDNIAKRVPCHWTQWSAEQREAFGRQCGTGMDRFFPVWRTITGRDGRLLVAPAIAGLSRKASEERTFAQKQMARAERAERKLRQLRLEMETIKSSRAWRLTRRFFPCAPRIQEELE